MSPPEEPPTAGPGAGDAPAPGASPPGSPRSTRRRSRRRLWLTLALLPVVALLTLYALRHRIVGPRLVDELRAMAEAELGLSLTVGGTGGNLLDTLVLRDLVLAPDADRGLERARVDEIEVTYGLRRLLAGELDALRGVRITGADLRLEVDGLVRWLDEPGDGEPLDLGLLPPVEVVDADVRLRREDASLEVEGMGLSLAAGTLALEDGARVEAALGRLALVVPADQLGDVLAEDVSLELADVGLDLRRDGDDLRLHELRAGERPVLADVALDLADLARGELDVEGPLTLGERPGRLALATAGEALDVELFAPEVSWPAWRDVLASLAHPPVGLPDEGVVDVQATLKVPLEAPSRVSGYVALGGRDWRREDVVPLQVDEVQVEVSLADGTAALERGDLVLTLGASEVVDPTGLAVARDLGESYRADLAGTFVTWSPRELVSLQATVTPEGPAGEDSRGTPTAPGAAPGAAAPALELLGLARPEGDGRWRVPELALYRADARLLLTDGVLVVSRTAPSVSVDRVEVTAENAGAAVSLGDLEFTRLPEEDAWRLGVGSGRIGARGHELTLVEPAMLTVAKDGRFLVQGVTFEGAEGLVRVSGASDGTVGGTDLELVARGLQPTGVLHNWLPNLPRVELVEEFELSFDGDEEEPTGSLAVVARGVESHGVGPLDVELEVDRLGDGVEFDGLLSVDGTRVGMLHGTLPWAGFAPDLDEELQAYAELSLERGLGGVEVLLEPRGLTATEFDVSLEVSGLWPEPEVAFALTAYDLDRPAWKLPEPVRWPMVRLSAHLEGGTVVVDELLVDTDEVVVEAAGRGEGLLTPGVTDGWPTLAWDLSAPVSGRLTVDGDEALGLLGALPEVRRASGELTVALDLEGVARRPRLHGEVVLTGGELGVATPGLASLTELNGRAALDGRGLHELTLTGELGAAPFRLVGDVSLGDDFVVLGEDEAFDLGALRADLHLTGEELLLYRAGGVKARADVDVTVDGPWRELVAAGRVALTDTRVSRRVSLLDIDLEDSETLLPEELFSLTAAPLDTLRFDVKVVTDEPITISNALLRGTARVDAHLGGRGLHPELGGSAHLDRSLLVLHLWNVILDGVTVHLAPKDLLASEVTGTGRSRMLGYDVLLAVAGPLEEPEIRFSSVPPLPEDDLLNLILTGQLPEEGGAFADDSRVVSSVAIYLGRDFLNRAFGDDSTETAESFLSRFELETGRNLSRSGSETYDARFRMFDDVFTGDDSVYIEVERSEFDETNGALRFVFRLR